MPRPPSVNVRSLRASRPLCHLGTDRPLTSDDAPIVSEFAFSRCVQGPQVGNALGSGVRTNAKVEGRLEPRRVRD